MFPYNIVYNKCIINMIIKSKHNIDYLYVLRLTITLNVLNYILVGRIL